MVFSSHLHEKAQQTSRHLCTSTRMESRETNAGGNCHPRTLSSFVVMLTTESKLGIAL